MTAPATTVTRASVTTTASATKGRWLRAALIGVAVSVAVNIVLAIVGLREVGVVGGLVAGGYVVGHLLDASRMRDWVGAMLSLVGVQLIVGLAITLVALVLVGIGA